MAAPALKAGDFVPDAALGTVTALVEEKTHRHDAACDERTRPAAADDND
jgi:hypothetical protein